MLIVLKCRFCYYYSDMARLTDEKMNAIENIAGYIPRSQEEGAHEETPGSIRRPRERGNMSESLSCGFHGKEQERQGKQV